MLAVYLIVALVSLAAGAAVVYLSMKGRLNDMKDLYEENIRRIREDDASRAEAMRIQFKAAASEILENNSQSIR